MALLEELQANIKRLDELENREGIDFRENVDIFFEMKELKEKTLALAKELDDRVFALDNNIDYEDSANPVVLVRIKRKLKSLEEDRVYYQNLIKICSNRLVDTTNGLREFNQLLIDYYEKTNNQAIVVCIENGKESVYSKLPYNEAVDLVLEMNNSAPDSVAYVIR